MTTEKHLSPEQIVEAKAEKLEKIHAYFLTLLEQRKYKILYGKISALLRLEREDSDYPLLLKKLNKFLAKVEKENKQ